MRVRLVETTVQLPLEPEPRTVTRTIGKEYRVWSRAGQKIHDLLHPTNELDKGRPARIPSRQLDGEMQRPQAPVQITEEIFTMKAYRTLGRCSLALILSFVSCSFWAVQSSPAQAQTRVNDRDMTAMMKNVHQDAKSFRPRFDDALRHSTIRKTSRAKDARDMAKAFVEETDTLVHRFKKDRNGEEQFRRVTDTARQMDAVVSSVDLGPGVSAQWQKIRTELHQIAVAYGFPDGFEQGGSGSM
jgi:hypothetical protein